MPNRSTSHRPAFAKPREQAERERKRILDQHRPNAHDRGYDADWERLRADYLAKHPFCCEPSCTKPATDVDHIKRVRDYPHLRLAPWNLRGFCRPHHSARTARDEGFAKRRREKR